MYAPFEAVAARYGGYHDGEPVPRRCVPVWRLALRHQAAQDGSHGAIVGDAAEAGAADCGAVEYCCDGGYGVKRKKNLPDVYVTMDDLVGCGLTEEGRVLRTNQTKEITDYCKQFCAMDGDFTVGIKFVRKQFWYKDVQIIPVIL